MKLGYKHNTGVFGRDAEFYVSSLFMMLKNPNGRRRPDLVTAEGLFEPKLSIELKSGYNKKGVMNESQLHYAVTLVDDYKELFGESPQQPEGFLPGLNWYETGRYPSRNGIAYYYDVINRISEVKAEELDIPYAAIKLRYGDQYVVPHEFGFYAFVVARVMRTGEEIKDVISSLLQRIKRDVDERRSHYEERREDAQSWQNLHGRDVLALFHEDMKLATPYGRKRIEMLRGVYPEVDDLEKVCIRGPNGSYIYILAERGHRNLFEEQLGSVVGLRTPSLETITQEREGALGLLESIHFCKEEDQEDLFGENRPLFERDGGAFFRLDLTPDELALLKRLEQWYGEGEVPLHQVHKGIPF